MMPGSDLDSSQSCFYHSRHQHCCGADGQWNRNRHPWLATVPRRELYTTVMTRGEIRYGLARLPTGRRRARLTERADALFAETEERLLAFDMKAADRYGDLVSARHAGGKPISVVDAIIASITWVRRATLATRNASDFGDCEIHVINPL
jgi:toxin FitB